jgi:hypothetical protein
VTAQRILIRRSKCSKAKSAAGRPHHSVLPTIRLTLTGAWARVSLDQAGNRNIDCNRGSRYPAQRENPASLKFLNLMGSRGLSPRINLRFQLFIHRPRSSNKQIVPIVVVRTYMRGILPSWLHPILRPKCCRPKGRAGRCNC